MPEALLARRRRKAEWLASREDEFSKLLAGMVSGKLVGGQILDESHLSEEEQADLIAKAKEAHPRLIEELAATITRVRERMAALDPFDMVGRMLASNVFVNWGEFFEPTHHGLEARVELVAGIAATLPPSESSLEGHDLFEATMAVAKDVFDYFELAMLASATQGSARSEGREADELLLRSRGEWLLLRGDAYAHHAEDLAYAIYDELADWMLDEFGFTLADLIAVDQAVTKIIEDRFNAYREFAHTQVSELVEQTRASAGPEVLQATLREGGEASLLEAAMAYVWTITDFGRLFSFTIDEVSETARGIGQSRISAALGRLSVQLGSIPQSEFSSALSVNPLVRRPFLRWGERYMLAVPGMLAREYPTLLEDEILRLRPSFKDHRAKVLDRLAIEYLSRMLPGSRAYGPLYYRILEDDQAKRPEVDGLVIFDDVALIVEGKAGSLSVQSRRGDQPRLKADIEESLQHAWEQGARARRFLLSGQEAVFEDEQGKLIVKVPSGAVNRVFIVNPTLHSFGGHAVQLPALAALGLFPEGDFPWSIYINDLRIIAESVANPAEFLHYMVWRNRLPLGTRLHASDEIDVFGAFLKGEPLHELLEDDPEASIDLASFSADFDDFYGWETGSGPKVPRPKKFKTPLVRNFLERLAVHRPAGWLEAAGVCLDMSGPELRGMQTAAPRLFRGLRPNQAVAAASGRSAIVALGPGLSWQVASEGLRPRSETRRVVFIDNKRGKPRIVWAVSIESSG